MHGDRHRPRPAARSRSAPTWSQAADGRLDAGRRPLLATRRASRALPASTQSTASCSTSAFPRCSSTPPSAASRSASTGRSTCAWAAQGAERRRCRQRGGRARSRRYHLHCSARSAIRAPSPAPSSRRATHAPITTTARARRDRRPRWCVRGRATSIRRRAPSRRCAFSSTTNSASWRARSPPPSACSSRAAGWSWSRSIRSKTASSRRSSPRAARPRGGSRHAPEVKRAAPTFARAHQAAGRRRRRRDRAQSARPLGQAARRRAHRRAGARRRRRRSAAAACRRLPMCCRGR